MKTIITITLLVVAAVASCVLGADNLEAGKEGPYITAPGGAMRMAACPDLTKDGKSEIVYGSMDNTIRCIDPKKAKLLWEYKLDAWGLQVRRADMTQDGSTLFLVPSTDSKLNVLTSDGRLKWDFESDMQLLDATGVHVAENRTLIAVGGYNETLYLLDENGSLLDTFDLSKPAGYGGFVTRLTAADLDGDGNQEICVVLRIHMLCVFKCVDGKLQLQHCGYLPGPRSWENYYGRFFAQSVRAFDADHDGKDELVMGEALWSNQMVMMAGGLEVKQRWISKKLLGNPPKGRGYRYDDGNYEFFSPAMVCPVTFDSGKGKADLVVVSGGNFRTFDADGKLLDIFDLPISFSDVMAVDDTLYLGSSPNGDQTIYQIPLDANWAEKMKQLHRYGRAKEIGENLAALREQVIKYQGPMAPTDEKYFIQCRLPGGRLAMIRMFRQYPNIAFYGQSEMLETPPVLGSDGEFLYEGKPHSFTRKEQSRSELIARAKKFEEEQSYSVVLLSHGTRPQVSFGTMEEILKARLVCVRGFDCYEVSSRKPDRFWECYYAPVLDKCIEYDTPTKMYLRAKNVWWAAAPANKALFDCFLGKGRGRHIVAGVETSNSTTYLLNLFALMGLRQAGILRTIQTTAIDDFGHASHHHPNWMYPKHGHPYFRTLLVGVLTGASDMHLRVPYFWEGSFTQIGHESIEILMHMIGKGILRAPRPEDMVGLSSVGLAMHEVPDTWFKASSNAHRPDHWKQYASKELEQAVLGHNGVNWAYSPAPEHALETVLFGKEWQQGYLPATPYGLMTILPAHCDLNKVAGIKKWLHCDGLYIWEEGGEKLQGKAAADLMRSTFEAAAAELPFRSTSNDVFVQTIRDGKDEFVIYAVGTKWFKVCDRTVEVKIQVPGNYAVKDLLSGESIKVNDNKFSFIVPAGSVRILTAERS